MGRGTDRSGCHQWVIKYENRKKDTDSRQQIVASSKYLGAIPRDLKGQNLVSWIPVDLMSKICVDLVEMDCVHDRPRETSWTKYYHLTNPTDGNWASLVPVIQDYFKDRTLEPVEFSAWVDLLEESWNREVADAVMNPALKLLDFYLEMTKFSGPTKLDATQAMTRSKSMQKLTAVNGEWMRLWLEQWDF